MNNDDFEGIVPFSVPFSVPTLPADHQDYILKKGSDAHLVKKMMLELLSARGAKYPAEHNVGHLYEAEPDLQNFYKSLDPTNTFNPGIGKMSKTKRNCSCCL